jgi:adenine-specific DNA methylase
MTFVEYLRKACKIISEQDDIPGYSTAVISYLAMAFDRLLTRNSNVCVWHNGSEQTEKVFALQALPMQWSYPESNPLEGESVTGYAGNLKTVISVIENLLAGPHDYAYVNQANSMSIPFQDGYFDAIFSDPPYYDNVAYADLSDFFYVWIKRTFNDLFPDLFITPLTPKSDEIIQDPARNKDSAFFQNSLGKAFHEMHRVLKDAGIAVIVYAYKSTMGWETLINALLDSGLVITGCWPLSTELDSRLNARETASLASSIYIVARKLKRDTTGFYNKVQNELKEHLNKRLSRLWEEGIGGADFFIAAIGSAIEIFGKYEKVLDYEGNVVRADRLLDDVRKIATDYAVHQILHNGFAGEVSDLTRFYVLYRWDFSEAKVEFDEARKLAQSCGIDLAREWNRNGFIKKDKEFIRVVGPQNRDLDDLKDSHELIDILHAALLLWEKGRRDDMVKLLHTSGFGKGDVFYRVAQAISETLPLESKEKKLLDGFLSGRERLREEVIKQTRQGRLI